MINQKGQKGQKGQILPVWIKYPYRWNWKTFPKVVKFVLFVLFGNDRKQDAGIVDNTISNICYLIYNGCNNKKEGYNYYG